MQSVLDHGKYVLQSFLYVLEEFFYKTLLSNHRMVACNFCLVLLTVNWVLIGGIP